MIRERFNDDGVNNSNGKMGYSRMALS